MSIMIICDDYLPYSTRVHAKMLHEMGMGLNNLGYEVIVLTPGTSAQSSNLIKDELDGIKVWRFRSGKVKDVSRLKRLVNESLLSYRAWKAVKPELSNISIEGVVYYSPSIFFGFLVSKIKNYFGCKTYLILRDLFPQWAIDQNIIRERSLIAYYLKYVETCNYNSADVIGLMSYKNLEVFRSLQPKYENLDILFNWVSENQPTEFNKYWRDKLGLQEKVVFLYGGNIGEAQDMFNLMRLAKALKNFPKAHFIIVGQGESFENVSNYISSNQLSNVTLMHSISQQEFRVLLSEVDVGLFSLAKNHSAHNFPGKVLGYISNALPILGSVNPGNDLQQIVNDNAAGFVFENGQDELLLNAAIDLLENESLRVSCGSNSRNLLDKFFSLSTACKKVLSGLSLK